MLTSLDESKGIHLIPHLGDDLLTNLPLASSVRFRSDRKRRVFAAFDMIANFNPELPKPGWYKEVSNTRKKLVSRGSSSVTE